MRPCPGWDVLSFDLKVCHPSAFLAETLLDVGLLLLHRLDGIVDVDETLCHLFTIGAKIIYVRGEDFPSASVAGLECCFSFPFLQFGFLVSNANTTDSENCHEFFQGCRRRKTTLFSVLFNYECFRLVQKKKEERPFSGTPLHRKESGLHQLQLFDQFDRIFDQIDSGSEPGQNPFPQIRYENHDREKD